MATRKTTIQWPPVGSCYAILALNRRFSNAGGVVPKAAVTMQPQSSATAPARKSPEPSRSLEFRGISLRTGVLEVSSAVASTVVRRPHFDLRAGVLNTMISSALTGETGKNHLAAGGHPFWPSGQ